MFVSQVCNRSFRLICGDPARTRNCEEDQSKNIQHEENNMSDTEDLNEDEQRMEKDIDK